jgi:hypothetical protein
MNWIQTVSLQIISTRIAFTSLFCEKQYLLVLGASAELQEATISFIMFVCPSVRMEQLGSH